MGEVRKRNLCRADDLVGHAVSWGVFRPLLGDLPRSADRPFPPVLCHNRLMFKGKVLLITGGTGSFGNAVLDGFLKSDLAQIRIFSRDEKKQDDMRRHYRSDKIKFYIGDVRDYDSIHAAMRGVDLVFSAAALKQVPSCEFYPL